MKIIIIGFFILIAFNLNSQSQYERGVYRQWNDLYQQWEWYEGQELIKFEKYDNVCRCYKTYLGCEYYQNGQHKYSSDCDKKTRNESANEDRKSENDFYLKLLEYKLKQNQLQNDEYMKRARTAVNNLGTKLEFLSARCGAEQINTQKYKLNKMVEFHKSSFQNNPEYNIWFFNEYLKCYEELYTCENDYDCSAYIQRGVNEIVKQKEEKQRQRQEQINEAYRKHSIDEYSKTKNVFNFNFGYSNNLNLNKSQSEPYKTRMSYSFSYERVFNHKTSINIEIGKLNSTFNEGDGDIEQNSTFINPYLKVYIFSKKEFIDVDKNVRAPRFIYISPSLQYNSGSSINFKNSSFTQLNLGMNIGLQGLAGDHFSFDFKVKYHPIKIVNSMKNIPSSDLGLFERATINNPMMSFGIGYGF